MISNFSFTIKNVKSTDCFICAFGYEKINKRYKQEYFDKFRALVKAQECFKIGYPNIFKSGSLLFRLKYLILMILHPIMYISLKYNIRVLFDILVLIRILLQNLVIISKIKFNNRGKISFDSEYFCNIIEK